MKTEYKTIKAFNKLTKVAEKLSDTSLQLQDIEIGDEYMYGGHPVTAILTYDDRYTRQDMVVIDDPYWKALKPVPVSELSLPVPDVAHSILSLYFHSEEGSIEHEMIRYLTRSKTTLMMFLRDAYHGHPELWVNHITDHIMKRIHDHEKKTTEDT